LADIRVGRGFSVNSDGGRFRYLFFAEARWGTQRLMTPVLPNQRSALDVRADDLFALKDHWPAASESERSTR